MLNLGLEDYFKKTDSSSSYFDFVEKKIEDDLPAALVKAETSGEEGLVVTVMDPETSDQLKRRYFNGYSFPE